MAGKMGGDVVYVVGPSTQWTTVLFVALVSFVLGAASGTYYAGARAAETAREGAQP